jgi:hypothetical protein
MWCAYVCVLLYTKDNVCLSVRYPYKAKRRRPKKDPNGKGGKERATNDCGVRVTKNIPFPYFTRRKVTPPCWKGVTILVWPYSGHTHSIARCMIRATVEHPPLLFSTGLSQLPSIREHGAGAPHCERCTWIAFGIRKPFETACVRKPLFWALGEGSIVGWASTRSHAQWTSDARCSGVEGVGEQCQC